MKRFLIVLFLLKLTFSGIGQNIKLIGSIYNQKDLASISYANITIPNLPIGTCTNNNGDFILYLPDSLAKSSLLVSCIGYKSLKLPVDSLIEIDTILIALHPMEYQLADITVVPGQNDVHTIMQNVISGIYKNYSRKKYYLEAFLRHRVFNQFDDNKTTVRLTEAAISIHKNHNSKENTRVQINEIRNSKNYAELSNSTGQKLLYKVLGGNQNPIYRIMHTENLTKKTILKNLMKNEHYSVRLKDVSYYDNELVYVIEFKQESWEFLFKKYYTTHTYRTFLYYINANDFAIIKAEKSTISHNQNYVRFVNNDSIATQSFIQYRKYDDKYYPSYIYYDGGIPDMVDKHDENQFYSHEAEMMINELATRRKDYDRIKNKYRMNFKTTLWDMEYDYNPVFWENYNILLDHPLDLKHRKDLEFEEPLEEQFKNNLNDKIRD
jgi:hypothetical protein